MLRGPSFVVPRVLFLLLLLSGGVRAQEPLTSLKDSLPGSPLPAATEVLAVTATGEGVVVDLDLPADFLAEGLDAYASDAIVAHVVAALRPHGFRRVHVRVRTSDGGLVPISDLLPPIERIEPIPPLNADPAPPIRDGGAALPGARPPAEPLEGAPLPGQGQPQGALTGRTVWLSPGHGWLWNGSDWSTQRPNTFGIVEDLSNAEAVMAYLARYLWNAGASVWLVRERSLNAKEIVVDNDDGAPSYTETGTWTTSGTPGYLDSTYRYANTSAFTTATARWRPTVAEAGWYPVYVWFLQGDNRAADVRFVVHHAGGETLVPISQEVHGQTWHFVGEFYFDAGTSGFVEITNTSADTGQVVIADAVRLGGGIGASGRPRFEEAALSYAPFQGFDGASNDVVVRPLYAEWELAKGYPGEDAVFISWHSNCCNASGTSSYIHDTAPTAGSAALQSFVHQELIADLRAEWNPAWVDRGRLAANFGEVRELSTMPGVLLEVAFHDTESPGDADDLKEPRFRRLLARAVTHGIVKYFADRDRRPVRLLPEPPTRLRAQTSGPGRVTLAWEAPPAGSAGGDAATSYKVYRSGNGRGFDNGTSVTAERLTLDGLAPEGLHYFRVTAVNAGGESFPTPVVAVRTPASGTVAPFLIVDGFDRLDKWAMIPQYEGPTLGTAKRMFLERMNRYDYVIEHARGLDACGIAFDSAVNEAVADGQVALGDYAAVDWLVGEDSSADQSLSTGERDVLADYLDGGGALLISGAELGYHLARPGAGVDPDFYRSYLKGDYIGDDSATYDFEGTPGDPFAGIGGAFDDSTQGFYDVDYPDRLEGIDGSFVALEYTGGTGDGAGVVYDGLDFKVVNLGFPLEAVVDTSVRNDLLCAAAGILLSGPELTVSVTGQGTVTSDPDGIACPGDCREAYDTGTVVDLAAVPESGWCLEGWSGDADCQDARLTMTASRQCSATFTDCPASCALGGQAQGRSQLDLLRALRRQLPITETRGQWLVAAYAAHAAEVNLRLLAEPALRAQALTVLRQVEPALREAVETGQGIRLDGDQREAIAGFADALGRGASPMLAADLETFSDELDAVTGDTR